MNPKHDELLGLCILPQHLTTTPSTQIVVLMDCLPIVLSFSPGDDMYMDSSLHSFPDFVKDLVFKFSVVIMWIPGSQNFLAHTFAKLAER